MTDLSQFHYYDVPPRFRAEIYVRGTASISVSASSPEEARQKVEAEIWGDDYLPDLDEANDINIQYIRAEPTRMYLISNKTSRAFATSRPGDGDKPREPTDEDTKRCLALGQVPSWLSKATA